MRIPLIGPSATPYSLAAGAQRSMNMYTEVLPGGEKNKVILRGRPGLRTFVDLTSLDAGATRVRGLWSGGGRLFAAATDRALEVSAAAGLGVAGSHAIYDDGGHDPVTILPNSNQLLYVASKKVFCDNGAGPVQITFPALSGQAVSFGGMISRELTPSGATGHTDTFDQGMVGQSFAYNGSTYVVDSIINDGLLRLVSGPGVTGAHDWSCTPILSGNNAAFFDGYYVVPRINTRQFNTSKLLNGEATTGWYSLDADLKEGWPDNIAAVWSEPPYLYMLGTETLQLYRNTGKPTGTPFEPVDGGFARVGLAATWSMASVGGKLHMIAGGSQGDAVAVRMEGGTPVRVSTHAVEEAWKGLVATEGVAYSYVERGHLNWAIGFTGAPTWVYDATSSALMGEAQWHERASWDGANWGQYAAHYHTFIPESAWGGSGQHIVGDAASGKLYELNSDFFDDDNADIRCQRTLAYVYHENHLIFHQRIEFELETGTAGTPPVVTLDWSDNRGQSFGTGAGVGTVLTLGPGVTGEYTTRYYARKLGKSRGRLYRITIKGKGRVALIDATLEAEIGRA